MCEYEPFQLFDDSHCVTEFDLWRPLLKTIHYIFLLSLFADFYFLYLKDKITLFLHCRRPINKESYKLTFKFKLLYS